MTDLAARFAVNPPPDTLRWVELQAGSPVVGVAHLDGGTTGRSYNPVGDAVISTDGLPFYGGRTRGRLERTGRDRSTR